MNCELTPISAFPSTNLNNRIDSFTDVGNRITRQLGAPVIPIELNQDQIMEFISQAVEFYTKHAGFTEEFIVFNSDVYERGKGVRMDHLFTLATLDKEVPFQIDREVTHDVIAASASYYEEYLEPGIWVVLDDIDISGAEFTNVTELQEYDGIVRRGQLVQDETRQLVINNSLDSAAAEALFQESRKENLIINQIDGNGRKINTAYDYDIMDYRKVVAVCDWTQGSTTGINTLFAIEQTLAQQTYFSYALGNHGFDLVSWYIVKDWMDMREKLLATKRDIHFDKRTQYLKLFPEPKLNERFYGVLRCYVEQPIRHVIKEPWVQQYALALSKIALGHIRGVFAGTQLFGGGTINAQDVMSQGIQEKERLEQDLLTGASAGLGSAGPPNFYIG